LARSLAVCAARDDTANVRTATADSFPTSARFDPSCACFGHALDLTRPAINRQGNWAAANAAIFDQRLLGLRRVDLQRERFTAMRTNDVCFVNQFHSRVVIAQAIVIASCRIRLRRPTFSARPAFLHRSICGNAIDRPAVHRFVKS
jgi:hypothetical protein